MKPAHLSHMVPAVAPTPQVLSQHVLRWLAARKTQRVSLDEVVSGVGARRAEIRAVLSSLHREGYYDVVRGRLTLAGFTVGRALGGQALAPLRPAEGTVWPGASARNAA